MAKHYVVLEFEQLHDSNVDNMPWADVLEGAVKVTNWRNITSKTIEDEAINMAIGSVFCEIDDMTSREAYEQLGIDADADVPETLTLCEQYEYESPESALELVDEFIGIFTHHTHQLLQMESS